MAMNWDAAAVGVAVLTFAIGQLISWWGGRRSAVVYSHHYVSAPLGELKEFASEKYSRYFESDIHANKFEIENKGRHLSDFSFRIKVGNVISYKISKTSSIDEDDVSIVKNEKGNLIISIPDFPSKEKISFDIFSFSYVSTYDPLAGGSSKFIITKKSDYKERRIGFFIGSAIAAGVMFFLFRSVVGA
jgi:hypothetical protein